MPKIGACALRKVVNEPQGSDGGGPFPKSDRRLFAPFQGER
jgi:hypothetical protein